MSSSPQKPKRSSNITMGAREPVTNTATTSTTTPTSTPTPTPTAIPATAATTTTIPPVSAPVASPTIGPMVATITLEGYLSKQAEKGRGSGWKKRWFSANDLDFKMFYYKPSFGTSNYDQVAGNIDLTVALEVVLTGKKNSFEIITSSRRWHLRATSEEQLNYWVTGLTSILSKKAPADVPTPTTPVVSRTPTFVQDSLASQATLPQTQPLTASSSTIALPTLSSTQSSSAQSSPQSSLILASDQKHSSQEMKLENIQAPTTPKRDGLDKPPGGIRLSIPGAFLEGYLQKQGEKGLVKSWKKRYFVAKGSKMWYYKQGISSSGYDQRAGFIDLAAVTKIEQVSGGKDKFQFQIHSPSRTWYLMGSCDEDVQHWLSGLTTLLASIAQQPTSTENVRSTMVNRSTSDTTWSRSAMTGAKQDAEFQRIVQRVNELEKLNMEKDKVIETLKEKSTKMEDKMILWNRIAFLNWAEATELDRRLAEAERARDASPDDEPYLKQIRLLKRQLNEKTFNCQVLEAEVEKLNAEVRNLQASASSSSSSLTTSSSTTSNDQATSSIRTPGRPLSEACTLTSQPLTAVALSTNSSSPNLMSLSETASI